MEKSEKVNSAKEADERVRNDWGGAHCPFWFFGNKDSAKNDLKNKFEIVDDEKKD